MPYNTDLVLYGEARGLRKVGEATKNQRDLYKPDSKKKFLQQPGLHPGPRLHLRIFRRQGKKTMAAFSPGIRCLTSPNSPGPSI